MSDLRFYCRGSADEGDWVDVLLSEDGIYAVIDTEFRSWIVDWNGADRGAPFVAEGSTIIQLEPVEHGYAVPDRITKRRGRMDRKARSTGHAGIVTFYADQACNVALTPWLKIQPANLSEEHYEEILRDLRSLVLGLSICVNRTGFSASPSDRLEANSPSLFRRLVAALDASEKFLEEYEWNLPQLERHPIGMLRRNTHFMKPMEAIRRGYAREVFRRSEDRRFIPVRSTEFSLDTPEREFVHSTLREVCIETVGFIQLLMARLTERMDAASELDSVAGMHGLDIPRRSVALNRDIHGQIKRAARLRELVERLLDQVGTVRTPFHPHVELSNRLAFSNEYRPFLFAWREYRDQVAIPFNESRFVEQIDEQFISSTPSLFERWATLKIYVGLMDRGFVTPEGHPSLLDALSISEGNVQLLGSPEGYVLARECHGARIELRLRHEPRLDLNGAKRCPDLVIDAAVDDIRETWVIDHKYKNYRLPAPGYQRKDETRLGSHFLADYVGVAEEKYRMPMDAAVGIIIHPDQSPEFTCWDPEMRRRSDFLQAPTPHAHLSLALIPGSLGDANLTKLLRLLLGFRLGLVATCWSCGRDCEPSPIRRGTQGDVYECQDCGAFWLVSWCKNKHRPIIKFGSASFHNFEKSNPFNVHCPWCGDFFR